jgi:AsmA protein
MTAIKYALLGIIGVIGLVISTFGPVKIPFAETLAKTYYRYAIVGLTIVLVLLGGLIAVAVNVFDPNQFKGQIVRWVQERTQRELALEGELRLSWFPKLTLETGKATLSQRRSAREFAAVDSARVTIAWLPLLRRQVLIDRVEVAGLRAHITRFKDGSTNVDDLWRDAATIAPASVDLDGVLLTRATLQWHDEIDFARGSLNELHVELGHLSDGQAGPLSVTARVDAPNAGIDAKLQLKSRLLFDSKAGRLELAALTGQLDGKALGIDNLALVLNGDFTAQPGQRVYSAENIVVTSASKSGLSVFNARLVAPELKFAEHRFLGNQLSLDASIAHPDQTVTGALQWPRFEWSDGALRGPAAAAQVSVRGSGAQLRGQLTSPLALHLDAGPRVHLEAIEFGASVQHPALAADLPVQARGRLDVDFALQTARLALEGLLASQDARIALDLADFRRPRWVLDADAARIDADALLSPAWLARWSDEATPFDPAALRELALEGSVRFGELKLGGASFNDVVARLDVQRSTFSVAPITAAAYGGTLDAALTIASSAAPRFAFKGSVTGFDARAWSVDVARVAWLQGRGDIGWELRSEGGSVGTLRGALAGSASVAFETGALGGIDLRAALLEGQTDVAVKGAPRPRAANFEELTRFSRLRAQLEVQDGRALAKGLELQSDALLTTGAGELTLASGLIDLRLNAAVLAGRAAPESALPGGTRVPLRVAGPWRQPSFAFDFGAAPNPATVGSAEVNLAAPAGRGPAAPDARYGAMLER